MKYPALLFLLLFPALSRAQAPPGREMTARNVLADLIESWTLGVDSNSTSVDIGMYNRYKSLFDTDARVDDDLNFRFVPGKGEGTYKIAALPRDFDEYAHDAALQVSKFRIDTVTAARRLDIPDSEVYEVQRSVYVEKPARYVIGDIDTLAGSIRSLHPDIRFEKRSKEAIAADQQELLDRLKDKLGKDGDSIYRFTASATLRITLVRAAGINGPLKIARIRLVDYAVHCTNDTDADGVLNPADKAPYDPGAFTASGAPDADLDGVPDAADYCSRTYGDLENKGCPASYFITRRAVEGSLGLQLNAFNIGLPELNKLGYPGVDVLQSRQGSLVKPAAARGIYAAGSYVYYFGRHNRHAGISAGFSYARFTARYSMPETEPIIYTYKANDGEDDYRRQVTIRSLTEKMALNVFTVPVQLSYRFQINGLKNWVLHVKAGPSLVLISGLTDYNDTIDVGGMYQVRPDGIFYDDYFDETSTWNVYLTSAGINRQNSDPGAAELFQELSRAGNYDFAADKVYKDQQKISRVTWALNFSLEGQYKETKDSPVGLKVGIHAMYAPSAGGKEKYKPLERTTDTYNSIFNSNGRSGYLAYGVHLGLVYDF